MKRTCALTVLEIQPQTMNEKHAEEFLLEKAVFHCEDNMQRHDLSWRRACIELYFSTLLIPGQNFAVSTDWLAVFIFHEEVDYLWYLLMFVL